MLEDTWFYYFSSLAQTIAACSALLVALAIIRLQNLSNSLDRIEKSIAEVFYKIDEIDAYREQTSPHVLDENWYKYLETVNILLKSNEQKFQSKGNYSQSIEYLVSLISQTDKLGYQKKQLHSALICAFGGSAIFAGISILIIPVAQWISPELLQVSWVISGFLLFILFIFYLRLVLKNIESM